MAKNPLSKRDFMVFDVDRIAKGHYDRSSKFSHWLYYDQADEIAVFLELNGMP